jgi:hypothetical protein
LSNLAHVLFARGDLTQSEALLRQALVIRKAALGEHHPDSLATEDHLTRLLQHRAVIAQTEASRLRARPAGAEAGTPPARDLDGAAEPPSTPAPALDPTPCHARPLPGDEDEAASRPAPRGSADCAAELALLTDLFQKAGEQLRGAGQRMQTSGLFPDASLVRALAVCHGRLSQLRAEVRGLAATLGVPGPPPEQLTGLREIGALLDAVARAQDERLRSRALGVLEQVLRLHPHDPGDHPALAECQAKARELHQIIAACPAHDPPPVVEQLALGEHPFACLLNLVNPDAALGHDQRTALQRTVAWAFGRPLVTSITQARVFLPDAPEAEHPADALPPTPESGAAQDSGT